MWEDEQDTHITQYIKDYKYTDIIKILDKQAQKRASQTVAKTTVVPKKKPPTPPVEIAYKSPKASKELPDLEGLGEATILSLFRNRVDIDGRKSGEYLAWCASNCSDCYLLYQNDVLLFMSSDDQALFLTGFVSA